MDKHSDNPKSYAPLLAPRAHHISALLEDGSVLISGGEVEVPVQTIQPAKSAAALLESPDKPFIVVGSTCRLAKNKDHWSRHVFYASTPFGVLPNEIIEKLLTQLEPEDVMNLSQVNTELYRLSYVS